MEEGRAGIRSLYSVVVEVNLPLSRGSRCNLRDVRDVDRVCKVEHASLWLPRRVCIRRRELTSPRLSRDRNRARLVRNLATTRLAAARTWNRACYPIRARDSLKIPSLKVSPSKPLTKLNFVQLRCSSLVAATALFFSPCSTRTGCLGVFFFFFSFFST